MNRINIFFSELIEYFGSQAKLAKLLEVEPMAISQMKTRRSMLPKYAIKIESLSKKRFRAVDIIDLFNAYSKSEKSSLENIVFIQRSAVLGVLGMRLMFEKVINLNENILPSRDLFLEMVNLEQLILSLKSDWLKCDELRTNVECYLRCLMVDVYNLDKECSDKSKEQHMYAQMYLTKGFSSQG
jgi:DNA-binding transcriptional regulator YdaS (Cro superfamily)